MSFNDTLTTLTTVLTPLLAPVPVVDRPFDIDNPTLPSINFFLLDLRTKQVWPGSRGQADGNPEQEQNLYGFVYLHAPASLVGETKTQAVTDMYQTVAALDAAFAKRSVYLLTDPANAHTPRVMSCGDSFDVHFDPMGPYIRYLDQLFIGCYGRVSVREIFTDVIYDV